MPRISIVVPVYNVQKYLAKCLKSLVKQTYKDIEIIVVDDGSPDESYKIYEKFAEKDKRVRFIRKENAGVSEARNTGIEMATGEWLMFVDSDDWMELDGCEILINKLKESGEDTELVVSDAYTVTNGVKRQNRIFKEDFITTDKDFIRQYQCACIGYGYNPMPADKDNVSGLGSPWNKLYNRKIIVENGLRYDPYVKGIYDDNLFTLHYLSKINKMAYVAKPVYDYRIVTSSLTQSYKANTLDISSRIFEKIREFIAEQDNPEIFTKPYYMYVIRRLSAELSVYYFSPQNPKTRREAMAELKEMLHTEPYCEAIRGVEAGKLMKQHKLTYHTAKLGWPFGMWITLKGRRAVRKLLKK